MAKKGGFPGMGGNMNNMMKQVQKMQKQMEEMQKQLEETEVEASSGGGVVTCRVNGSKEVIAIEIKPEAIDPEDREMLQDMIVAAVNEAIRKVDSISSSEMGKLTGGMNIPGMF